MKLEYSDFLKLNKSRIINPDALKSARIDNVSVDSRKCGKNDLFIAIKGEAHDGHDYIEKMISNGVRVFLASKKWFFKHKISNRKVSFILADNTLKSMGELAAIYRNKFLIPVIAVAGSNGKTSTKDFISNVLSFGYNVHNTKGNYNNAIGVPLTLFGLREQHDMCVVEIGTNHFGEIENLCKIVQPQFGVITNIGKEHLEFLKNIRGVVKEELALAGYLGKNFGTFFLNNDDKYLAKVKYGGGLKIFSYGSRGKTDVKGKIKGYKDFFPEIEIGFEKKKISCTLKMLGKQSFESALCSAAIGMFFEVPVNKIKKALSAYHVESKKRNELKKINNINILDDTYNSNPDSVKVALDNISKFKIKGETHIILGDMLELGKSSKKEHYVIGRYVKKLGYENLYTYGKESYQTFLGAKGVLNNFYFKDKPTLGELLKMRLRKDDFVLVKGSRSMKMEDIIEIINNN
ncbi:MAG: UDP-N-acetylmuramoyl-tripeptide--D-alanyl-D-alanine ligase [Ignavibacteria bacterium]